MGQSVVLQLLTDLVSFVNAAMTWQTTSLLFQSSDDSFPYGQFNDILRLLLGMYLYMPVKARFHARV